MYTQWMVLGMFEEQREDCKLLEKCYRLFWQIGTRAAFENWQALTRWSWSQSSGKLLPVLLGKTGLRVTVGHFYSWKLNFLVENLIFGSDVKCSSAFFLWTLDSDLVGCYKNDLMCNFHMNNTKKYNLHVTGVPGMNRVVKILKKQWPELPQIWWESNLQIKKSREHQRIDKNKQFYTYTHYKNTENQR